MKSQCVNFLATSRASPVIPHTEHLHQAVSCCFWLLLLCYGLSHCSGKASQPKDATCFLVNCCKDALSPPCRMSGCCGGWTSRGTLSSGFQWNEESPGELGLIWAVPTMKFYPWFSALMPCSAITSRSSELLSASWKVVWTKDWVPARKGQTQLTWKLVPNFKIKTESH